MVTSASMTSDRDIEGNVCMNGKEKAPEEQVIQVGDHLRREQLYSTPHCLIHHISGQLHSHKHSAHEERQQDANKGDAKQQDAIESRRGRLVRLIQHDESQSAHGE